MPLREFRCFDCEEVYEELVKYDEEGKYPDIVCPGCGSSRKEVLISRTTFNFTNPVGTDLYNSSHDYRFRHKLPQVIKERQEAEMRSKMGRQPYSNIDDVSSGNYFGEAQ